MKQEILHILPVRLREGMQKSLSGQADAEEIRIRIGQPPDTAERQERLASGIYPFRRYRGNAYVYQPLFDLCV